ncbi:MAG TPA: hypothetical protein VND64_08925 [Pirellulales bacterium]|nr:hypothetical protein [Pirellulales bacterium]
MIYRTGRPNEGPLPDPLAFFMTWSTYGTWLPGDERGWVEYRHGWQLPDLARKLEAAAKMTEDACILDDEQRGLVERTISEHCDKRRWELFAVNCRTNHLHIVVGAHREPDEMRSQFKAWCTRRLKELDAQRAETASTGTVREKWWAERGSRRYVNDKASLAAAIAYVTEGQDGPRAH